MKLKLYLFCMVCFTSIAAIAQLHNSFDNALTISEGTNTNFTVCQNEEYFLRTKVGKNGTVSLKVESTNKSGYFGYIYIYVFDGRRNGGRLLGEYVQSSSIAPGAVASETFKIRGLLADSLFIKAVSSRCFNTNLSYTVEDIPVSDAESNDSFSESNFIAANTTKQGNIHYYKSGTADADDYYLTVLPANGTMNLHIKGTNRGAGNGYMYAYIYDAKGASSRQFGGYIQSSSIVKDGVADDIITLKGRANDSMYFRLIASNPFAYEISYSMTEVETSDTEPNETFDQAIKFTQPQTKQGIIGYYKKAGSDGQDYYATKLPIDGAMKIYIQGTNRDSRNGYMYLYGYDERRAAGQRFGKYIGSSNIAPGETTYDTITVYGQLADSFYLKLISSAAFVYSIKYEMVQETESEDPEPNNSFTDGTMLTPGVPTRARIQYTSGGVTDADDYYKAPLPGIGTMRVIVNGTNKSSANGYMYIYIHDSRQAGGRLLGDYVSTSSATPNQTVIDTFYVYGRLEEMHYIRVTASQPFNYTLQYDLVNPQEVDAESNNVIGNAVVVNEGDKAFGNIGYSAGATRDGDDYFKLHIQQNGSLQIAVKATNNSNANGYMYVKVFDQRGTSGQIFADYMQGSSIKSNEMLTDTILIKGAASGDYYINISSAGSFGYSFDYAVTDIILQEPEPNATFETADTLIESIPTFANIGYRNGTGTGTDADDYYVLQLRENGTLTIAVNGKNKDAANGYLYMYVYNASKGSGRLLGEYIQSSSIGVEQSIKDTFRLKGRAAGTYYVRMTSTKAFEYDVTYFNDDVIPQDPEPNNSFTDAVPIPVDSIANGNIGYVSTATDNDDYYAGYLPEYGTLRIIIHGKNNGSGNGYIYTYGYDGRKQSGQLFGRYAGSSSIAPGAMAIDTILVNCRAVDSFYYRITSSASFSYWFKYEMINSSIAEKDTNNTFTTATALPIDSTLLDNIGYVTKGISDGDDYFVTKIPSNGSVGYIINATNTSSGNGYLYAYLYEKRNSTNAQVGTKYLGGSSSLPAGRSFTDTVWINCATYDTVYLRLTSSGCFKFTVKPIFINREPQAIFTKKTGGGMYEFINESKDADSYNWNLGNGTSTTKISPDLVNYSAGSYDVVLTARNATCNLTDDTTINVVVRGLNRYSPLTSGPGNVEFTAYGGGFNSGMKVTLTDNGRTYKDSMSYVGEKGNLFVGLVDLHNAAPGVYDVTIQTNDTTYTIPDGFTVESLVDRLRTEIIGRDLVRANTNTPYSVRIHNEGNTMAGGVEVHVLFPSYMQVTLLDSLVDLLTLNEPNDTLENLKPYRTVTTELGYPINGTLYSLYIAGIAPGAFRDVDFTVKSGIGRDAIYSWVIGPLSGSEERGWVSDCNKAIFKTVADGAFDAVSVVPGVDCVANTAKAVIGTLYAGISYLAGWSSAESAASGIGKNVAGAVKNCAGEIAAATGVGLVTGVAPAIEFADAATDWAVLGSNLDVNIQEIRARCPEDQPKPKEKPVEVRTSLDPNAKSGPAGIGAPGFINGIDPVLNYTIFFENIATAGLPAQVVRIVDTLDKSVLDLSTFRAISYRIADSNYVLPMDAADYISDVPMDANHNVRFSVSLDTATGVLTAELKTIDISTGTIPEDPTIGFLPPNLLAPEGEGNFSFALNMIEGLPDGTPISNKSHIYFDNNEPIATNTWLNTLDRNLPTSQVLEATQTSDTTAILRLTGTDPSSGVRNYLLYASDNGGSYYYAARVSADTISVVGDAGHTYSFFVRAVDSVGNVEQKGPSAEGTVTLGSALPVNLISFAGTVKDNANLLTWATATESNNHGFRLQKSLDGTNFSDLAFIPSLAAGGNSQARLEYHFADSNYSQLTYYRLVQVDLNGRSSTSNTVLLQRQRSTGFTIAPNPASNYIIISSQIQPEQVKLLDMQGRTLKVYKGNSNSRYDLPQLPTGLYLIQVQLKGKTFTQRLSIQ